MHPEQRSTSATEVQPKLRELRHLVLLAEELHFARAAERAYLSQSAFSRSIASVEENLGLRLFDRGPRHVRPTPAGERVILRARRLLSSVQDLSMEAAQLRTGELGDIALGSGPFTSVILATPALVAMHRLHPRVCVRLEVTNTLTLAHYLQEERIAFFISDAREVPAGEQWLAEPLGQYHAGMYCRASHPLARRKTLSLADLKGQQFTSVHLPEPLRSRLHRAMDAAGTGGLSFALECENVAVLREFALATDAIVMAPHHTLRSEIEAGRLRPLHPREFGPRGHGSPLQSPVVMVRLGDRTPTTSTQILMDVVRQEAKRILTPAKED